MTIEDRIAYWRGRARLAKRLYLHEEAASAARIAAVLNDARRGLAKADAEVDRLFEAMPEELYAVKDADR